MHLPRSSLRAFQEGASMIKILSLIDSSRQPSSLKLQDGTSRRLILTILCGVLQFLVANFSAAEDRAVKSIVNVDAKSFRCITKMKSVRQFYVNNLLGNLDATLAVANSPTGGTYPEGSVIQLVPTEVMVKREKGFSPVTKDWEFFELDLSNNGTQIRKSALADVVTRFGGNCFACHIQALPQWDVLCEVHHRCPATPPSGAMPGALPSTD